MSFMPETATDAVRVTEVSQEFTRAEEVTAYIEKCVEELEAQLGRSILAQHKNGAGQADTKNPEPVRVPLAQSLYEHSSRLERIRERLSSILNRLEA